MRKHKINGVIIDIVIGILAIGIFFALYSYFEYAILLLLNDFIIKLTFSDYLNLVITQFSTTFLIVSLLSLLSVKGQYIYWEEAVEYKIILPRHFNFISSSIYAFLTLLGSLLALLLEKDILVIIFFLLNTLILTFLTFRMTSIFFDRDAILRKLKKNILRSAEEYAKNPKYDIYCDISNKLNALYENTYKMAAEKDYKQIVDSNISLILELAEQLNCNYNNELAKLYYSTLSRIFMIFQNDSNYFLSVIYYKYKPFEESSLSQNTQSMLQNALYDLFEAVLRNNQYRVAYDYWIIEIYEHLEKNYWKLLKQKSSTGFITDEEYVNYEGEELFIKYDSEINGLGPLEIYDKRFSLVEERYIVFCQLLAQNNSTLLLQLIQEHDMALEIMDKISLLQIISTKESCTLTENVFQIYLNKQYSFPFEEYIANYNEYQQADEFIRNARAEGGDAWSIYQIRINDTYILNPNVIELLNQCIHKYSNPWMIWMVLNHIQSALINIANVISDYSNKNKSFIYHLLINKDTERKIIKNAYITNPDSLLICLHNISNEICIRNTKSITSGLIELCERKIDIPEFAERYKQEQNMLYRNIYLRENVFKKETE